MNDEVLQGVDWGVSPEGACNFRDLGGWPMAAACAVACCTGRARSLTSQPLTSSALAGFMRRQPKTSVGIASVEHPLDWMPAGARQALLGADQRYPFKSARRAGGSPSHPTHW